MERDQYIARIFELLRRYNRKARFVGKAYGSALTLTESHLVVELEEYPNRRSAELANALGLDTSTVSRSLSNLVNAGILKVRPSPEDGRARIHRFTNKGRKVIATFNENANKMTDSFAKNLTSSEMKTLRKYFQILLDGQEAPQVPHRKSDIPVLLELRRFSRAWGVIGRSLLNSGHSTTVWHILSELRGERVLTQGDFAELLTLAPNTISAIVKRLEKDGFVKRQKQESDRRRFGITLTRKGQKVIDGIDNEAFLRNSKALENTPLDELLEFTTLVAKFVSEPIEDGALESNYGLELGKIETEEDLFEARAFVVEALVRENRHLALGEGLLGAVHENYWARDRGDIVAVLELEVHSKMAKVKSFALAQSRESEKSVVVLRSILQKLSEELGVGRFSFESTLERSQIFSNYRVELSNASYSVDFY